MGKRIVNVKKEQNALNIIDQWLAYQYRVNRVPGFSVGILHKGKIIFSKGYGQADMTHKKKATPKTLYRIASNSKMFTAVAIMQLFEQEKLQLDDPVKKYLSWFKSKKEKDIGHITIRQLLTHTSGLKRDGFTEIWGEDAFPEQQNYFEEYLKKGMATVPVNEMWKYSNTGYALLGEIVAAVSGISYQEYVQKYIIDTLQLKNTGPEYTPAIAKKLACGYGEVIPGMKRKMLPHVDTKSYSAATGFYSNVEDLCHFASAQFLNNDRLLSRYTKKEMQRVHWSNDQYNWFWGLGFEIWKVDQTKMIGHSGGFHGFITRVAIDVKNELAIVVLTNAIDGFAIRAANSIVRLWNYVDQNFERYKKPTVANSKKYTGIFHGIFGEYMVMQVHGQLLGFFPHEEIALSGIHLLKYKKEHYFEIQRKEGVGFEDYSDSIRYLFEKNGTVAKIGLSSMTLYPLERALKHQDQTDKWS